MINFDSNDFVDVQEMRDRLAELAESEPNNEEEQYELELLREALDDIGECAGAVLIRDRYMVDYVRELAYDIGEAMRGGWLDQFVDWEKAADAASNDYRMMSINSNLFLVRS